MNLITRITSLSLVLGLCACSSLPSWMGAGEEDTPLPGERKPALESRSNLSADPTMAATPVSLPPAVENNQWFYDGQWNRTHLAANTPLKLGENTALISAASKHYRLSALPVVAGSTIYLLGGEGEVVAYDTTNLKEPKWTYQIPRTEVPQAMIGVGLGDSADPFQGGGLTFLSGGLFVTTSDGRVMALDSTNGTLMWERSIGSPIRSNPVAYGNALYFITIDNEAFALSLTDGTTLWNVPGVRELTGVLGHPSPAVSEQAIVVPFSSGDLYALSPETGKPLWTDSLAANTGRSSSLFTLNDIDATPVIVDTMVYTVSHEGKLRALELTTGKHVWEQNISSLSTPWVSGDFLYIITTNSEVLCLNRMDGRIKWVTTLKTYRDEEGKQDRIVWNGPLVAGENLFIVGSEGTLIALSPYDGSLLQSYEVPEAIYLPPLLVGGVLYLLNNEGGITILN